MRKKKKPQVPEQQAQPVPTATPTADARRRLLKRLATGSGVIAAGGMLPGKWTAPVVQSVILPAHAAASPGDGDGGTPTPTPDCDSFDCAELEVTHMRFRTTDQNFSEPFEPAEGCNGECMQNEWGVQFTVEGVPDHIQCAMASMREDGDTGFGQSMKQGTNAGGGTWTWETNGQEVSAATGNDGCHELVIHFFCTEDCDGSPGQACVIGYFNIMQGDDMCPSS